MYLKRDLNLQPLVSQAPFFVDLLSKISFFTSQVISFQIAER